jgi:uncharacterized protein (TIGR00730 family)
MKALCVLIGASIGRNPAYLEATKQLGKEIAKRNIKLIYGGGRLGLMGILADTVLENGGKVVGVITKQLYEQEAHLGLSELQIVESMQDRKKIMVQFADGFVALPGGLGTLEEIFEIWNASKLKIHNKPFGLLNTDNYFNKLIEFVDYSIHEEFLKNESRDLIKISDNPISLLNALIKPDLTSDHQNTVEEEYISMFIFK